MATVRWRRLARRHFERRGGTGNDDGGAACCPGYDDGCTPLRRVPTTIVVAVRERDRDRIAYTRPVGVPMTDRRESARRLRNAQRFELFFKKKKKLKT